MRYVGQGWEIPVELPYAAMTADSASEIRQAFEATYRDLFGRTIDGLEAEITNWSLTVATRLPEPLHVTQNTGQGPATVRAPRHFFDAALRRTVEAKEVERAEMRPGIFVNGPAVITERETSTIVTSAYRAIGQSDGSLLLLRKEG